VFALAKIDNAVQFGLVRGDAKCICRISTFNVELQLLSSGRKTGMLTAVERSTAAQVGRANKNGTKRMIIPTGGNLTSGIVAALEVTGGKGVGRQMTAKFEVTCKDGGKVARKAKVINEEGIR